MKTLVVSIPDSDVTPLALPETGEEIVVPVDALGEPEADVDDNGNADVSEKRMAMETEIHVQVLAQVRRATRAVCTLIMWFCRPHPYVHIPYPVPRIPHPPF